MVKYALYQKLSYYTGTWQMFSKITNYFHILKARIIIAYVFFCVSEQCSGASYKRIHRQLIRNTLFLMRHPFACFNNGFPRKIEFKFRYNYERLKEAYDFLYKDFFKQYTAHRKTSLADYAYVEILCPALGSYFPRIIGVAWLCEKLGINVKFTFPDTYITSGSNFFENPVLNYAKTCHPRNFTRLKKPLVDLNYRKQRYPSLWEEFTKCEISSEYGYKIISKLSIKQEIQQQADQWSNENIREDCVGVHYRQTDVTHEHRIISIDNYINYLKKVIDDHYQIYACSDNADFINAIHEAFSGRVVSRDIIRSKDFRSLHRHEPYAGHQQRQDALIDMLTLAKVKMIYTVGSSFINTIRFFNPAIKIIALTKIEQHHTSNYISIPQNNLIRKARADQAWKKLLPFDMDVPNIENKK